MFVIELPTLPAAECLLVSCWGLGSGQADSSSKSHVIPGNAPGFAEVGSHSSTHAPKMSLGSDTIALYRLLIEAIERG